LNQYHDIDIPAPLDVKTYRTEKVQRTSRREKKEAGESDDETKSPQRQKACIRTRQEKRKRRFH
jgi:sRNA-binding carbon storage regulator CsrA